jgi:hypothetical protein
VPVAATVGEAVALLRRAAPDVPPEGVFADVTVEVRGDPGLGTSPDPELLPEPLVLRLQLVPFRSTHDDRRTLRYPDVRGLRVVVVGPDGDAQRLIRHGSLDDVRTALADSGLPAEVCRAFRGLVTFYCQPERGA